MAMKEVVPDPYEPKSIIKLQAVGDFVEGYLTQIDEGQYGLDLKFTGGRATGVNLGGDRIQFKQGEANGVITTAAKALRSQIEKAQREGLEIGMWTVVGVKALKDIKKENPMKVHIVRFDPDKIQKSSAPSSESEDIPF